jgi:hypothetical protein
VHNLTGGALPAAPVTPAALVAVKCLGGRAKDSPDPCLLLTRNYKHFGVLGVRTHTQGVDGVMAVVAINIGEMQVQAVVTLPALPFRAVGAGMKWATDRIGPWAWVILGVISAGGVFWYCKQPPGRRKKINKVAGQIGAHLLDEYEKATDGVHTARLQLRACAVPRPEQRGVVSAVLRELALSPESLSAQQLAELLPASVRPSVADLRAFLRKYDGRVFDQVRRGRLRAGISLRATGLNGLLLVNADPAARTASRRCRQAGM